MCIIRKKVVASGNYHSTVTQVKKVSNGQKVIMDLSVKITECETMGVRKWFDVEPFWGSDIQSLLHSLGLLENDEEVVNLQQLVGTEVQVALNCKDGVVYVNAVRALEEAEEGVNHV